MTLQGRNPSNSANLISIDQRTVLGHTKTTNGELHSKWPTADEGRVKESIGIWQSWKITWCTFSRPAELLEQLSVCGILQPPVSVASCVQPAWQLGGWQMNASCDWKYANECPLWLKICKWMYIVTEICKWMSLVTKNM